jgi:hypothetical protein
MVILSEPKLNAMGIYGAAVNKENGIRVFLSIHYRRQSLNV